MTLHFYASLKSRLLLNARLRYNSVSLAKKFKIRAMKKKIIVGMSGGVDSSVAALLLQQQGYEIEGLFMKNWEDDSEFCSATEDAADAQNVCDKLGIKLHTVNFSDQYWEKVFAIFLAEYKAGRTPNPDILCNKEIKFKAFLNYALDLGADGIATGHYVCSEYKNDYFQLLKGLDKNKDQSYFLYSLSQEQLKSCLFPIGKLEKPAVRLLAQKAGFLNSQKKDSTGICFIGERKFKSFLNQYLPAQPGDILDENKNIVGKHDGLMYYTIGQRKGIGVGGLKEASPEAWYVIKKDLENNQLIIGQGGNNPALFADNLVCGNIHWIAQNMNAPYRCYAKTRYRQSDQACTINLFSKQKYKVSFDVPQRAITPGQSIVFYNGEQCLGGAVIHHTMPSADRDEDL